MRDALAILGALLLVSGCAPQHDGHPRPSAAQIDRVEAALARAPCIGTLNGWERSYRYARKAGTFFGQSINPDLDVIEMHLRHAGTVAVQPGRTIVATTLGDDWPDVRGVRAIDGRFRLGTGTLQLRGCPRR